ncbi:hypothetical protein BN1723_003859 [Verticillium longisporum]|uniref:Uncharacterized protein n=1 Tax=Verticillium longisporum TaxID=100787 RepID=A0A0G4MDE8_VERLO|nr:hypothetical protein BN1723_003859 [Verticillium longisporum]
MFGPCPVVFLSADRTDGAGFTLFLCISKQNTGVTPPSERGTNRALTHMASATSPFRSIPVAAATPPTRGLNKRPALLKKSRHLCPGYRPPKHGSMPSSTHCTSSSTSQTSVCRPSIHSLVSRRLVRRLPQRSASSAWCSRYVLPAISMPKSPVLMMLPEQATMPQAVSHIHLGNLLLQLPGKEIDKLTVKELYEKYSD